MDLQEIKEWWNNPDVCGNFSDAIAERIDWLIAVAGEAPPDDAIKKVVQVRHYITGSPNHEGDSYGQIDLACELPESEIGKTYNVILIRRK